MPDYWMDADTFIESKKGPYAFDIAPGFWRFLDEKTAEGTVASSSVVYHEIVDESDDDLASWAREREDSGLFIEADQAVQQQYRSVADPWVIAHAMAYGGVVVTFEKQVPSISQKVKIPNVASHFGIKCKNVYELARELRLRLA